MKIKQSVCFPIFRNDKSDLDKLFKSIAGIGFSAVEFWFRDEEFKDIVRYAHKHGLVVAGMCGHYTLGDGLNKRSNHDRIEAELKESIDLAAKNRIPGLICFAGNRQPHQTDEDAIAAVVDGFKRIAPYAEKKGINLNMELLNSKVNHPGYQCDHTAWGVAVCEKVNSPRVKLLYDIYHMQIMEGDVIRTIRENIRWIGHFHTAGNPGRNDMDDTQELNYRGICSAIAATDYRYYLGHEFSPKGDLMPALRRAFEMCNAG